MPAHRGLAVVELAYGARRLSAFDHRRPVELAVAAVVVDTSVAVGSPEAVEGTGRAVVAAAAGTHLGSPAAGEADRMRRKAGCLVVGSGRAKQRAQGRMLESEPKLE